MRAGQNDNEQLAACKAWHSTRMQEGGYQGFYAYTVWHKARIQQSRYGVGSYKAYKARHQNLGRWVHMAPAGQVECTLALLQDPDTPLKGKKDDQPSSLFYTHLEAPHQLNEHQHHQGLSPNPRIPTCMLLRLLPWRTALTMFMLALYSISFTCDAASASLRPEKSL